MLSLFSFLYPRADVGPVRITADGGARVEEYRDPSALQSAFTAATALTADETRRESDLLSAATRAARDALAAGALELPLHQLAYTR